MTGWMRCASEKLALAGRYFGWLIRLVCRWHDVRSTYYSVVASGWAGRFQIRRCETVQLQIHSTESYTDSREQPRVAIAAAYMLALSCVRSMSFLSSAIAYNMDWTANSLGTVRAVCLPLASPARPISSEF